jgi:high-affinity nickel-transport protein
MNVMNPDRKPADTRPIAMMAAALGALHLTAWAGALLLATREAPSSTGFLSIAAVAYTLGARHAFDADHIAAIDNATRALTERSRIRPVSVGFWFSLGHSSVVFAAALLIALGARTLLAQVSTRGSSLHTIAATIGPLVSSFFLLLVAAANIWSLRSHLGRAPHGSTDVQVPFGPLTKIFSPVISRIHRPASMYPVGFLFGLGFDTATEITLLTITATATLDRSPWYIVLLLPLLFAAGMSLFDSVDGVVMSRAYSWCRANPDRRQRYNTVITAVSAVLAGLLGVVQLAQLLAEHIPGASRPLALLDRIDSGAIGIGIVTLLLSIWVAAFTVSAIGTRRRTS